MAVPEALGLTVAAATTDTEWHALAGWGGAVWRTATVVRPRDAEEVADVLRRASESGRRVTIRGAGRSYGDAALPADRLVLDPTRMRRVLDFDPEAGRITVEPGVTIETLWRTVLPAGWWPPVVPGTMRPTVGGCVAMNVHGKNHAQAGTFGEHVERLEMVLVDGERRVVEAGDPLFRAVVGGAGLLGVVTSVTLRLKRVTSGLLDVVATAHPSYGDVVETIEERCADTDYAVGWIDAYDVRARGVTHTARHLGPQEDPGGGASLTLEAQDLPPRILRVVPRSRAAMLLRPLARPAGMRLINAVKYRAAAWRGTSRFRQSHAAFHFLLDYVPGWKSIYAPGGLIQHQSFVPAGAARDVHGRLLALCRVSGMVPWLGVVKRHRPDDFLLSHAVDGFSLALDFRVTAANRERLWQLCDEMDRMVLDAGGRFYLAKDLTASPETFHAAYPGLGRFLEWKRELDPGGVLTSALAERLEILDAS